MRRTPYASRSMRTRRSTKLGFQPPAIGEEELAGRHRDAPVGVADHGAARGAARGARRRVSRRETRARGLFRDGRDAPGAARARRRAGRRGDHDADHLARDRQRDRALRRPPRVLRRPRGRPQHRRRARPGSRHRADEGDPAGRSRRSAVRPRSPARSSVCPSSRTRRTRSRASIAAGRSASVAEATCFSLYATKNVAAGEGGLVSTNRDDVAGADPRDAADAPRRRIALRPDDPGLQGKPLRRAGRDRTRPARPRRRARRASASTSSRSTTTGSPVSAGSSRSRGIRATSTPVISTSSASTPSPPARRGTSISARSARS